MTLEKLAKDIAASAEAEAKAALDAAKAEAKTILAEAESRADSIRSDAAAKAEKEAGQIARETVASARQANQKEVLVARRAELDATFATAREQLGDAGLKGRSDLLDNLLSQAGELPGDNLVLRPTAIDRASLKKSAKGFSIGEDVDGIGGFVIESADGTISYDMRFDTLLDQVWSEQKSAINNALFG